MSKNYAIIIHFMLPLTTFYRSGAHRSDVYKWDAFVTSWRFYNRAWQPQRHDRLPETSGTLWIHRGALTNQRCSLATGCGIKFSRLDSAAVLEIWFFYKVLHIRIIITASCLCMFIWENKQTWHLWLNKSHLYFNVLSASHSYPLKYRNAQSNVLPINN